MDTRQLLPGDGHAGPMLLSFDHPTPRRSHAPCRCRYGNVGFPAYYSGCGINHGTKRHCGGRRSAWPESRDPRTENLLINGFAADERRHGIPHCGVPSLACSRARFMRLNAKATFVRWPVTAFVEQLAASTACTGSVCAQARIALVPVGLREHGDLRAILVE